MAGFDFQVGLEVAHFLFAIWFVSWIFQKCKLPPILGQLVVGIFYGPNGIDMVPYASDGKCWERLVDPENAPYPPPPPPPFLPNSTTYSGSGSGSGMGSGDRMLAEMGGAFGDEVYGGRALAGGGEWDCTWAKWDRWEEGTHLTNIWTFVGNLGVTLMIMESGMHIHFDKVAAVGKKATIVAIFGTGLPIAIGIVVVGGLMMSVDPDLAFYPWGFAAGCAFAPTSVGISIRLLDESKMLNSMAGQTTLIAAFIDDVFSLVTLVILQTLAKCQIDAGRILVPLICSFAFLIIGAWLAIKVFPHVTKLLEKIPLEKNASIQPRDQLHIGLMFMSLFGFGYISSIAHIEGMPFIGSHLLGAFVAGMVWVNVPRSHTIWENQLKRIVKWMMRLFFACSVGFAVPVSKMFSPEAVWRGIVLGIGPCISTKLFSGLFARMKYKDEEAAQLAKAASWATKVLQPQQLLVGIAMVARGEFAYLVAETAAQADYECEVGVKMMSEDVYAATMWALVMATIAAPVMFRWALGVFDRATAVHRSVFIGGEDEEFQRKAFNIRIAGKYKPGVQREIFNTMYAAGVDILDSTIVSVRADDSPDAEISQFINNFTVLSRGKKKDFDDEKLEEMHHAFTEILNDSDAQVIFAPPVDVPNKDGVVEIQVIGEHHEGLLKDIVDELCELGLDVIKAHVDQSLQPGGHGKSDENKVVDLTAELHPDIVNTIGGTTGGRRNSLSAMFGGGRSTSTTSTSNAAAAPDSPAGEGGVDNRRRSLSRRLSFTSTLKMSQPSALDHVIYSQSGKDDGRGHGDGTHHLTVGSERFYVREVDKSKVTDAERRNEIKVKLCQLLKKHRLHGEVMVRTMHASEMAILHTLPKLTSAQKESAIIVKCSGKHHKDLLHEMIDHFTDELLEVLHAEVDDENGEEVILFWLKHEHDDKRLDQKEKVALKAKLKDIYVKHGLNEHKVIVGGDDDSAASKKLRSMRRVSKELPDETEVATVSATPTSIEAVQGAKADGIVAMSREARKSREARNSKEAAVTSTSASVDQV